MKVRNTVVGPRKIRAQLGLNQSEFWTSIGVTQSGGSRYEAGRSMPKPVLVLLQLVHVERIDLSKLRKIDLEILRGLKSQHPEIYRSLRKGSRRKTEQATDTRH